MTKASWPITELQKRLNKQPLFFVCRDIERAEAGLYLDCPDYHIITNQSPLAKSWQKQFPKQIHLHKTKNVLDTIDLIKTPLAQKLIKKNNFVLVFKSTASLEKYCAEKNYYLLNPSALLAKQVEEKISQYAWLGNLSKFLPPTKILVTNKIIWKNTPFILQFNHAHTGQGTYYIQNKITLVQLQKLFPHREARVVKYITGPTFTSNNLVCGSQVLMGNISYQITGLLPFTDNQFATIGNDWTIPAQLLPTPSRLAYKKIVTAVGQKLANEGWRGLFGIDAIMDIKTKKIYLIEINARQPASTNCESLLQHNKYPDHLTIFAGHLLALLGIKKLPPLTRISKGAQLVQKITLETQSLPEPKLYSPVTWRVIQYNNHKLESDLMRLQINKGIVDISGKLNANGNELAIFVSMTKREIEFNRPRAGLLVIKNNKILLIKRNRSNYIYWVIPGGTMEENETLEETAIRELAEESNLVCEIDFTKKPIIIDADKKEIYYFTKSFSGRIRLGGPEKTINSKINNYRLVWEDITKLKKLNILSPELKIALIKQLKLHNA